jgi:tetratricopeptide (TPR) repeat protein
MIQSLLFSILLWIWDNRSFDTISRSNRAKIEAKEAYQDKNYERALESYQSIANSSLFAEPEARLNLAHSYFQLKQLKNAERYYLRLSKVKNPFLASRAFNQLGVIETMNKDTLAALQFFRESLRQNPENHKAQYNFELLKKRFKGKETTKIPKNTPKKEELAPKPAPPEQISQEAQKTEEKKNLLNKLKNLSMSEAQAMMVLDALKASEIQYLQQQRHRSSAKNDDSKGKW